MTLRILHLGFGAFHRAHQAWHTQRANAASGEDWRITGVSMTRRRLRDALAASDFAYDLGLRGSSGLDVERIAVHDRILIAADEPEAVIQAIADDATKIVTLTITEKGYRSDATEAATIAGDPWSAAAPCSAIGLLTVGLARRAASKRPITVLSCDNVPGNGDALARLVRAYAEAASLDLSEDLSDWIAFPNTMVDRITPAVTDDARQEIAALLGRDAPEPVLAEAFSDWVIEDAFAAERPAWERAGATLTEDVAPFEARKLRMLNAAHSFLAAAGPLRGHRFVHEAAADPTLRAAVEGLWDEAAASLPDSARRGAGAYREALMARFDVPEVRHHLSQIATDASLKMALRIAPIVGDRRAAGADAPNALSAIGAWLASIKAAAKSKAPLDDPNGRILLDAADAAPTDADFVQYALRVLDAPHQNTRNFGDADRARITQALRRWSSPD